jgi:membrane protein YqaA with SNARE-associated domain
MERLPHCGGLFYFWPMSNGAQLLSIDWFSFGFAGLFVICFLSATILPLSSEGVVLLFLAGDYAPLPVLAVASLGNCAGGALNYYLGYAGKKALGEKWKSGKWSAKIERTGAWLALLAWVPVIGDPLLLTMGFYRTPQLPTLLLMCLGKIARYSILVAAAAGFF